METRNPRTVVAVILGGGAGTRLFPLTKRRAKPAVSALQLNYLLGQAPPAVAGPRFGKCEEIDLMVV